MSMHQSVFRFGPPVLAVLRAIAGVSDQVAARGIGPGEQAPTEKSQPVIARYRADSQEQRDAVAF